MQRGVQYMYKFNMYGEVQSSDALLGNIYDLLFTNIRSMVIYNKFFFVFFLD